MPVHGKCCRDGDQPNIIVGVSHGGRSARAGASKITSTMEYTERTSAYGAKDMTSKMAGEERLWLEVRPFKVLVVETLLYGLVT